MLKGKLLSFAKAGLVPGSRAVRISDAWYRVITGLGGTVTGAGVAALFDMVEEELTDSEPLEDMMDGEEDP